MYPPYHDTPLHFVRTSTPIRTSTMRAKLTSHPSSDKEVKVKASSKASDRTDVALEITSTVLTTLQLVAAVASPIPGLQEAAKLASNIITTAQVCVRKNVEEQS